MENQRERENTEPPYFAIRQMLQECGAFVAAARPKRGLWSVFLGICSCVMSVAFANSFSVFLFGLFLVSWGLFIRPRFFSKYSERFWLFQIFRALRQESSTEQLTRYAARFASSLSGNESPYALLDGRFIYAFKTLSNRFLLQFNPDSMTKHLNDARYHDKIGAILSSIFMFNTIMALADEADGQELEWPEPYREPLIQLVNSGIVTQLDIAAFFAECFPALYHNTKMAGVS